MEGILLTMKEVRVNDVMAKLVAKNIKIKDAMRLLGLSKRQILRKKKAYIEDGIKSVPHKSRNKPTGKGYPKELKDKIIELYEEEYLGWNFCHFNDFLEDEHNIKVSDTFIYNLLTSSGFESPHKYKQRKTSHPPRKRRENAGELIQCDASEHPWFFEDDKYYFLHGGIDDSTGIVTGAYFAFQETIVGYQMVMYQTIQGYGIPEELYTDYRTIFKSNKKELSIEEELLGKTINNTKFAKMLERLGTGIISTDSPQAKGRIERLWRTFQDRLYKELKKKNINTIKEANDYLIKVFIPKYNTRFASIINDNKNSFVKVDSNFDFNTELAVWEEKSIYRNCYLRINKKYYVIYDNGKPAYITTKNKVRVYTFLDGSTNVLFNDKFYTTKIIDIEFEKKKNIKSLKSQAEINALKTHKPASSHPWKNCSPNPRLPKLWQIPNHV